MGKPLLSLFKRPTPQPDTDAALPETVQYAIDRAAIFVRSVPEPDGWGHVTVQFANHAGFKPTGDNDRKFLAGQFPGLSVHQLALAVERLDLRIIDKLMRKDEQLLNSANRLHDKRVPWMERY